MAEGVNKSNCLMNLQLALEQDKEELAFVAMNLINKHAEALLSDKAQYADLNAETLQMVFLSDDLKIKKESLLFQVLTEWTLHDENRQQKFCELLRAIRLPLVATDYIKNVISKHSHLEVKSNCVKCRAYLRQTMQHLIDGDTQDLEELQTTIRNNNKDKVLISVYGKVKTFDFASNSLSDNLGLPDTSRPYSNTAVAIHDDIIYILGHELDTKSFYCDYKKSHNWSPLPNMPHDHNDHIFRSMVIVYKDSVLIIGGFRNERGINTIDCYDTDEQKWVNIDHLNAARSNPTSVVHDSELYTIGGWNNGPLSSVEKYNLETKAWTNCRSMNQAREIPALESYKGKIFAVGGYTVHPISSAETYDAKQNLWTTIASLNVPRTQFGAFVVKGKLIIIGGHRYKGTRFYETWSKKHRHWKASPITMDYVMHCKVLAYA